MTSGSVKASRDAGFVPHVVTSENLMLLKAVYYPSPNELWVKARSDVTPMGTADITVTAVRNGQQTQVGQLVWRANKQAIYISCSITRQIE